MSGNSALLLASLVAENTLEQITNVAAAAAAIGSLTRLLSLEEPRKKSQTDCQTTGDVFSNLDILEAVHRFNLFKDSKDFVDSPLQASPEEVLSYFWNNVDTNNVESVQNFVSTFWKEPGSELVQSDPADWQAEPETITKIKNCTYKEWALRLHDMWKNLCRKMKPEVHENPERFSLVHVPHSFVVPGGRFREFYYWDSYWVIKGLLVSGMFESAKDMIRNFVYLVDRFGFIPNGGRTYLLNRSQPPFLLPMVYDYYKATKDEQFLREVLPSIQAEYDWWWKNRVVNMTLANGKSYTLFQYRASTRSPRPESYKEDVHSAAGLASEADKEMFYQSIAAACESGWDFSSRWFADGASLSSCHTTQILPVDLNAMMCFNTQLLGEVYGVLGNAALAQTMEERCQLMKKSFNEIFWDDNLGCWFDYLLKDNSHNHQFYASCVVPIFANAYDDVSKVSRAFQYFQKCGVLDTGLATSLRHSGQQWDFPNAWSPLVHMLIVGLRNTMDVELQAGAATIASNWLKMNHSLFSQTGFMFEKYNVTSESLIAGGGEYEIQTGFGWSNGVVLDLISIYGDCEE